MKIKSSLALASLLVCTNAIAAAYQPIKTTEKEVKMCHKVNGKNHCYRTFPNKKGGITGCVSVNGGKEACRNNPMSWGAFIAQLNIEIKNAAARTK